MLFCVYLNCVFFSPFQAVASDGNVSGLRATADEPDNSIDAEVDYHKLGKIQFNIKYDFQEMTLTLKIMRAINLPAKDFSGTSDPYVKIMLLPDKKHKLQTNIKRKNLNPRWNELFAFEGKRRITSLQVFYYFFGCICEC